MDTQFNGTPALGLPSPSTGQPASDANYAQVNHTAVAAAPSDSASDDLDQEWVNKAKAIVEKTRNDPHIESKELSRIKADYLRTRYNKHIKVDD